MATMQLRAAITIATMVKMPVHQWQRCRHGKGDNTSFTTSDESKNDQ
jgi:hypothetical protein